MRLALGASGPRIARLVLRNGLGLAVVGVAAGRVAAFGATRVLSGLLYDVEPTDPLTFAAAAGVLLIVAAAGLLPARAPGLADRCDRRAQGVGADPAMTPSPIIRWLARVTCRVFYRVDCVGTPPSCGPVLVLPNHPNSLLDPAVIWATSGRDVRFLAKSTLFDSPLRPLLAGAGAIPVYRKLDQGVDVSKNAETFAAVDAALPPAGRDLHLPGRGQPLDRTAGAAAHGRGAHGAQRGARRNARGAGPRRAELRAQDRVPLTGHRRLRPRVLVRRSTGSWASARDGTRVEGARPERAQEDTRVEGLADGADAEPAAIHALTDRIAEHMRRLLIEADPKADAALVERVDRLCTPRLVDAPQTPRVASPAAGRLRRAWNGCAPDPQRYEEILLRFRRYDQRLRRFGFRDLTSTGTSRRPRRSVSGFAKCSSRWSCCRWRSSRWPPLRCLYYVTGYAARWFTQDADVAATAKVLGGFVIYAAWLALLAAGAWWFAGTRTALVLPAGLLVVAVAGLFAIERESGGDGPTRAWFLLRRTNRDTRERLRRRRSELADVLDEVNAWLASEKARRAEITEPVIPPGA